MANKARKTKSEKLAEQSKKLIERTVPLMRAVSTLTKFDPAPNQKAAILDVLQGELDNIETAFSMPASKTTTKVSFSLPA